MATYARSFSNNVPGKIALKRFNQWDQIDYMVAGSGTSIIPGALIEMYKDTDNVLKWRPHSSATAMPQMFVALDFPEMGQSVGSATSVDTAYVPGDIVHAWGMPSAAGFWGFVASGQTVNVGDPLQSAGDGTGALKAATSTTASAGVYRFISEETIGAVTVLTRCKARRIA
jgi:hypothetical protein